MAISMSGGPFAHNRFDDYDALISEKKQGYNDKLDDTLGEKDGKEADKEQSDKDRRDESKGEEKAKGKRAYSSDKEMDKVDEGTMNSYVRALSKMGQYYQFNDNTEKQLDEIVGLVKGAADTVGEVVKAPLDVAGKVGKSATKAVKDTASGITEDVSAEEVVLKVLMDEGYVTNATSGEVFIQHMSDEWFNSLVEGALQENAAVNPNDPAFPEETKAQASAQSKVRSGNMRGADKTKGVSKSPGTQGGPGIKNYNKDD